MRAPTADYPVPTLGQKIWHRLSLIPVVVIALIAAPFAIAWQLRPHRWRRT